ncbi:hypothetical protein E2L08_07265 [Palleronia sediminis]|uniref:Uncharacterized protein n=1 Tax=Palleronia sediminis TaxID=2547833 RepID=A0A4V3B9Z4_9RHOB|nr:hypothetical protein [Palleronia sediminis]TDL81129.1 hypothetical protein E2L08_07265 [Palleronia sediminis]
MPSFGLGTPVTMGVNAAADDHTRLVVAANASALSHDGGDHRLTINKAGPGDTASLCLQSDWSGRAEIGLAGSDALSVKVSPDGTAWTEALRIDPGDASVSGAAIQQNPGDTTPGRLMRADWGYGPGNAVGAVALADGQPTGALIERDETPQGHVLRFADGSQVCWTDALDMDVIGELGDVVWSFPRPFAAAPAVTMSLPLDPARWSDASARRAVAMSGTGSVTSLEAHIGAVFATAQNLQIDGIHAVAVGRWA